MHSDPAAARSIGTLSDSHISWIAARIYSRMHGFPMHPCSLRRAKADPLRPLLPLSGPIDARSVEQQPGTCKTENKAERETETGRWDAELLTHCNSRNNWREGVCLGEGVQLEIRFYIRKGQFIGFQTTLRFPLLLRPVAIARTIHVRFTLKGGGETRPPSQSGGRPTRA